MKNIFLIMFLVSLFTFDFLYGQAQSISTYPEIVTDNTEFQINYKAASVLKKPLFTIQLLTPELLKTYCVKALPKANDSLSYYADFHSVDKAFLLFLSIKEEDKDFPLCQSFQPVFTVDTVMPHLALLRLMSSAYDTLGFNKFYNIDSIYYPNNYERYETKWEIYSNNDLYTGIHEDIKYLESTLEKTDSTDLEKNISLIQTLINGYVYFDDFPKMTEYIEKLSGIYRDNFNPEFFNQNYRIGIFSKVISKYVNNPKLDISKIDSVSELLRSLLFLGMSIRDRDLLFEFIKYCPDSLYINKNKELMSEFCNNVYGIISRDIENKNKIEHYLRREYLFRDFSNLCKLAGEDDLRIKTIDLGIKFLTPYNRTIFSKDTNDLVTMFNCDDGFLEGLYYQRAEYYKDKKDNKSYTDNLKKLLNKFTVNNNNKYSFEETLIALFKFHIENDSLDNAKKYLLNLANVNSYRAKSNIYLLNNYLKKKNIDTLDYQLFLESNNVYLVDFKELPNNIVLSTETKKLKLNALGDSLIIIFNINETCPRCNEKVPALIDTLCKSNSNIIPIALTDLSAKVISDYIGRKIETIKKNDKIVKELGIDIYKESNKLIVIKKGRIKIEDDFINYQEFIDKYIN